MFIALGVNALSRAFPISTLFAQVWMNICLVVSMPFGGLIPFLHPAAGSVSVHPRVSMPFGGLIPFLPSHSINVTITITCVNALWRAYPISTSEPEGAAPDGTVSGVNALWRAYPISTEDDKNEY